MECVKLFLGCLMMLAFVFGTLGADCDFERGWIKKNACYTDQGLLPPSQPQVTVAVVPLAGLANRSETNACSSKQSNLIEALGCELQFDRECGSDTDKILPSPDLAGDIVKYECEQSGIDIDCIFGTQQGVDFHTCITQEQVKLASKLDKDNTDNIQIQCAAKDFEYKCMKAALEQCGSAEDNYVAKYVTGSFRPKACGEYTDGSAAILVHPGMLFLCLFAIMLRFFMA